MSHTPVGGHPQGWDHKLADRSSLPPASGEERAKSQAKHVFASPLAPKGGGWREETEGSSGSSARTPSSGDHGPAPYLRWARTLHDLLEDAEGVRLFRKFVASAGGLHLDRLNFYFAVQGLRHETEPAKIQQVVSAIYKFLRKSQLTMPEELRARVKQGLKEGSNIERTIFDAMEHEMTRTIMETTYEAFLRSESYVTYVSAATQPLSSPDTSSSPPSSGKEVMSGAARDLPTLHEGQELCTGGPGAGAVGPPARLTKVMLMATQDRRQQPDLASSVFARKNSVYSYPHLSYAAYCPASRQDSERGSMSSGRTDSDVMSMSGSSLDGKSVRGSREARDAARSHRPRLHGLDRHSVINKDPEVVSAMVIPRTHRVQSEQLRVLPPDEFGPLLINKLEKVRRDLEAKEKLDRRLMESESEELSGQAIPPQMVAAAIREKLQVEDDNDQDILDQHVSRVWSERTPGGSPPGGRRVPRTRRRPPSTLSADSGHFDAPSDIAAPHAHQLSRRSIAKKAPTELTDSGVSVVSEGTSAVAVEPRILQWIQEGTESRHGRRSYLSSRASSAERASRRGGGGGGGGLAEPDLMPPLPGPHVPTQLDEARRRLQLADPPRHHPRANRPSGSKGSAGSSGTGSEGPCTVVVFSFLDENLPYRIKVPAAPLTLKLFKDYLPRKGNYRYFFKTECADLDNTVIQEEICNDSETLPMFEGKVMARVKSIE